MTYNFRPAQRVNTPIIVGLAGPSKSGKSMSALRLAVGLSEGGKIAMINTEGPRGHQYAGEFKYDACDILEPFSMKRYEEAIKAAAELKPAVLIIDSVSHSHEGIGGMLDQHEKELDRMAGTDYKKRDRMTWAAWIHPKKDEADMINSMLQTNFHIVLCFRAKEKIKIIRGQDPVDLGWRPIASDRIHFETAFTLILPPNSKGTPDLSLTGSELRSPFDTMITGKQIDEDLGKRLAEWAKGGAKPLAPGSRPSPEPLDPGSSLHKMIEAKIAESGVSRDLLKQYLFSIGKIELKDDKPSFSTMTNENAGKMVDNWDKTIKLYEAWRKKQAGEE